MKRYYLFFLFILLLFPLSITAQEHKDSYLLERQDTNVIDTVPLQWPRNLQAKLNKLLDDELLKVSLAGIIVYDLTADTTNVN